MNFNFCAEILPIIICYEFIVIWIGMQFQNQRQFFDFFFVYRLIYVMYIRYCIESPSYVIDCLFNFILWLKINFYLLTIIEQNDSFLINFYTDFFESLGISIQGKWTFIIWKIKLTWLLLKFIYRNIYDVKH